jgi:hypothetical protein
MIAQVRSRFLAFTSLERGTKNRNQEDAGKVLTEWKVESAFAYCIVRHSAIFLAGRISLEHLVIVLVAHAIYSVHTLGDCSRSFW